MKARATSEPSEPNEMSEFYFSSMDVAQGWLAPLTHLSIILNLLVEGVRPPVLLKEGDGNGLAVVVKLEAARPHGAHN